LESKRRGANSQDLWVATRETVFDAWSGPLDPLTFAVVPAVLGVLTMLACLQPARRAMAVDPLVTLKQA